MRKLWTSLVISALCMLAPAPPVHGQALQGQILAVQQSVPDQYIVVLNDRAAGPRGVQSQAAPVAHALAATYGGTVRHVYQHALNGFSVRMPRAAALALSRNPQVAYVEEDGRASLAVTQSSPVWSLDRIDQRQLPLSNTYSYDIPGAGVNVYVIDSGIRDTHQEFGGRASRVFDALRSAGDANYGKDGNGHGTHVAGTIGGSTYDVAKGVRLYGLRVLDDLGYGSTSGVVAAVDWVTAHRVQPAVANMSLQSSPSSTLDTAVGNSIASGVTYVVASGNGTDNDGIAVDASGFSPSRVAEAIIVGATDMSDNRRRSSNYGSVVDVFAPGEFILSAGISSDTATQYASGTSMAAPHVAGVAALYLQSHPGMTPENLSQVITSNATSNVVINPGPGSPNRLLHSILVNFSSSMFQSYGVANHYLRHRSYLAYLTPVENPQDRQDASFVVVPGLAGRGISFLSVNHPNHYLRHLNFRVRISPFENNAQFRSDATFYPRSGLADASLVSFESVSIPGYYLRHRNYEFWLDALQNTVQFRSDATFRSSQLPN